MAYPKKSAFTLVELIVVIAVLAVLATIAFTTVQNISSSARNSARVTDISTIASKLEMQLSFGKILPKPENGVDLIASGAVVGYQGNFGTLSARTLELSEIKDPLDKNYYTYTVDSTLKSYQLLGFKESTTSFVPANTAYADASTRIPFTRGKILGILLDTASNTAIEKTYPNSSVDIVNTSSGLTAVFSDTKQLSGTGFSFGGSMWNLLAKQTNFDAPKTCPTGFIPVPGNTEFLQPGFCVMKYEAKALGGNMGPSTGWNSCATHDYQVSDTVVSTAADLPIGTITQLQAITACNKLGDGYHLITNNEWMTLARNIEAQGNNWSNWITGSGFLYMGHSDNNPVGLAITATTDDTKWYFNTGDSESSGDGSAFGFGGGAEMPVPQAYKWQKRTLVLSNNQIIWDLSGNIWEHVNKANTLNGSGYANNQNAFASTTITKTCPWWPDTNCFEPNTAADMTLLKTTVFSLNNYDSSKGVGLGYAYSWAPNNIFVRGWSRYQWSGAGIFSLLLYSNNLSSDFTVGFRCTK